MDKDFQIVLCAGAPDTPEIAVEMKEAVEQAKAKRSHIIWIEEMLNRSAIVELYAHAAVFCCPSIYEPFGIINLEAMACGTAVVASAVGGIKEVVVDEETGYLVPFDQDPVTGFPTNPDKFVKDLGPKLSVLLARPEKCERVGHAARKR